MGSRSDWTHKRSAIVEIALAGATGLLLTLAFPKAGLSFSAWIALVPLFISIRHLSVKKSFRQGLIAGFIHYVTLLYWLLPTLTLYGYLPIYLSVALLLLLSLYLALFLGGFTALLSRFAKTPLHFVMMAPFFFTTLEHARSIFFTGFPWGTLGYSQHNNLTLIQFCDITGVLGVSFLLIFSNGVFFLTGLWLFRKKWAGVSVTGKTLCTQLSLLCTLLCIILIYGKYRIRAIDVQTNLAPQVRVAAIQGNVDQAVKWDHAFQYSATLKHLKLSKQAMKDMPDLIVWPETAAPFYFNHDMGLSNMTLRRIRETGAAFLIGCPSYYSVDDAIRYLNSAIIVTPDGEIAHRYDKVHLVPYGEYVPLKKYMPFLGKMVAQSGDFVPGEKGVPLAWNDRFLAVQICFEIIFPELCREIVKNGGQLIVNITNDAWFGKTAAPYQHFAMTRFRAIENRRALVRAANTGISGFVSPTGRVLAETPLYQEAALTRSVPLLTVQTFYTRYAGFLSYIYLAMVVILVVIVSRKRFGPTDRIEAQ